MPSATDKMLTSAKTLIAYFKSKDEYMTDEQEEMLTHNDKCMYLDCHDDEVESKVRLYRLRKLEYYAKQMIANFNDESDDESDDEEEKPKSVLKGRVIPLSKQSDHQKCWGAWTKKMTAEFKHEINVFKAELETKGLPTTAPHLKWISKFKNTKSPEYLKFKAEFK